MRSLRKRIADVQDGYLDLENVARMEIPAEDLLRHTLQPGDVLMNQGGDFEKLGRGHVWDGRSTRASRKTMCLQCARAMCHRLG